jgi:hypothetical protein
MTNIEQDEACVSKKSWGEVLSRSLKLFTFNAAREGGKSFGRVVFYVILGIVVLVVGTYVIDSITGWFSSWFDFWPLNRTAEVADAQVNSNWFNWGAKDAAEVATRPVVEAVESEPKWYCKWNPIC